MKSGLPITGHSAWSSGHSAQPSFAWSCAYNICICNQTMKNALLATPMPQGCTNLKLRQFMHRMAQHYDSHMDSAARYVLWVGPAYVLFGMGLSLYFSSLGAGKAAGPVLAGTLRMVVVAVSGAWPRMAWPGGWPFDSRLGETNIEQMPAAPQNGEAWVRHGLGMDRPRRPSSRPGS